MRAVAPEIDPAAFEDSGDRAVFLAVLIAVAALLAVAARRLII